MKKELIEIDINSVVVKSRLRENNGNLGTLEKSIRQLGLLSPIIIDRDNILIAGGRRLAACHNIGLTKIAAFRMDIDANTMTGSNIQSDENLCREPLTSDELEKNIQMKKSIMSRQRPKRGSVIFSKFKKIFVGSGTFRMKKSLTVDDPAKRGKHGSCPARQGGTDDCVLM